MLAASRAKGGAPFRAVLVDDLSRLSRDRRIRACEQRIANLTEALAKVGWSEALASKLRDEESTLGNLKAERAAAAKHELPRVVPSPAVTAGFVQDLFPLLERDRVRGREILARFVAPIVMTPEAEGPNRRYRATGAFNLSFLVGAAALGDKGGDKSCCAGAIPTVGNGDFRAD